MAKTNTLTSHQGESCSSRADKMSGIGKEFHRMFRDSSSKYLKHFMNRKRRMFLKNEKNWDKI